MQNKFLSKASLVSIVLSLVLALGACGNGNTDGKDTQTSSIAGTVTESTVDFDIEAVTAEPAPVYANITVDGIAIEEYKIYSIGAPGIFTDKIRIAVNDCTGKYITPVYEETGYRIELVVDPALEENSYRIKSGDGIIRLESDTETGLNECLTVFEQTLSENKIAGETRDISFLASGAYATPFEKVKDLESAHFYCETNKSALSYEIGEEMTMTISLLAGGELASCPTFKWTMKGDDGKRSEGTVSGINGKLTLSTTLDTNGFVMVSVKALDAAGNEINNKVSFSGAMGVHPELITKTTDEPSDFDAFWENTVASLDTVEPEIIDMTEVSAPAGFEAYKIKLACVGNKKWLGDTYVSGFLSYPKNAAPGSLKLRASFQGYGVSSPSLSCGDGYVTFSVSAHSMEIDEDSRYYSALNEKELKNYGWFTEDNADKNEVYYKYMLLRDLQALRFMKQYFGEDGNGLWDGETLSISGSSQGGFQVIAIAALDKDVTSVWAGVPWLCDIGGYTDEKRIKSSFRPDYCPALDYFDSVSFAKRVTCPISITAGLGDTLCPPAGIAAMYNALSCPKTIVFNQAGTHGPTQPDGEQFTFSSSK